MINNLLLWACVSVNHKGLKLGEALGVGPEVLRQVLLKSSGNNWTLETWPQPRPMPWPRRIWPLSSQRPTTCASACPCAA